MLPQSIHHTNYILPPLKKVIQLLHSTSKTSTLAHHILYTFTTRTVAHSFSHNIVRNITIGIITQVNHWFFSSSHHHTVTSSHSLTLYSMAILSPRRSRAALRSTVRYIHTYIQECVALSHPGLHQNHESSFII